MEMTQVRGFCGVKQVNCQSQPQIQLQIQLQKNVLLSVFISKCQLFFVFLVFNSNPKHYYAFDNPYILFIFIDFLPIIHPI